MTSRWASESVLSRKLLTERAKSHTLSSHLFGYVDETTSASPDTTTGSETTVDSTILTIDELSTEAMATATLAESLHSSEQPGDISTLDALDATPTPSALPSAGIKHKHRTSSTLRKIVSDREA